MSRMVSEVEAIVREGAAAWDERARVRAEEVAPLVALLRRALVHVEAYADAGTASGFPSTAEVNAGFVVADIRAALKAHEEGR